MTLFNPAEEPEEKNKRENPMVRTLGPRSVSSFLKIFLDVVFVLLALGLVWLGVLALLSAVGMANSDFLSEWRYPNGRSVLATSPRRAAGLLSFCLFTLGLLGIVGQLRKIFVTLIKGSPFVAENARRLRVIGLILAALEASRFGIYALLTWGLNSRPRFWDNDLNFTALFAIGAMFVLAEVFDEGVKMKKDLELTI
jgi:hypothetical protein